MLCSGFYLCGDSSGRGVATKTQNGEFQPTSAGSWLDVTWLVTGCHTAKGGRQRSGTNQCQMSVQRQIWHCFLYLAMKNQNRYFPPALAGQPRSPSYEEVTKVILFFCQKTLASMCHQFQKWWQNQNGVFWPTPAKSGMMSHIKESRFFSQAKSLKWNGWLEWRVGNPNQQQGQVGCHIAHKKSNRFFHWAISSKLV